VLFTVDFIPIETVQFRDLPDGYAMKQAADQRNVERFCEHGGRGY
jgi:hypothetical protein